MVEKFVRGLITANNYFSMILLAAGMVIVFFFIVTRWLLNYWPSWGDEISMFAIVWASFIITGKTYAEKKHIAMDILINYFSPAFKKLLDVLIDVFTGVVGLIWAWAGLKLVLGVKSSGMVSSSSAQVPMWMVYSVIPIGGMFLLIFAVLHQYMVREDL